MIDQLQLWRLQATGKDSLQSESGLRKLLLRLIQGENLSSSEAAELLDHLLDESTTDAQIAATLIALSIKGETVEELTGLASAMRARALPINCCHSSFIDTAGTGSSRAKTFNVSTAATFVIAGAGLPVAKHGNRAATSKSGSADVLSELGVNITATSELSQTCLNEIGICFMFAPLYHGATKRVVGVRRELGVRTAFNLLGPLTNPARAPYQIVGVWHEALTEPMAQALSGLGTKRAWVVHGLDGLDEVTITQKSRISEVSNGKVRSFEIEPEDFNLNRSSLEELRGGDPKTNATIIREVLEGKRRDAARDLVVINSAAALYIGEMAKDFGSAVKRAEESIDSGQAVGKLDQLIKVTNS
jgi:anthranilate phosphoribosyltransferase